MLGNNGGGGNSNRLKLAAKQQKQQHHKHQQKQRSHQKAEWRSAFAKKHVGLEDMTLLSKVSNEDILRNLQQRHSAGQIYTYIGHVLISVNPYRELCCYTEQILQSYRGRNRIEMPPHVFAIAETAFHQMAEYGENQCVIISGESGAVCLLYLVDIVHLIIFCVGQNGKRQKDFAVFSRCFSR
jgi:myosin-1